MSSRDAVLQMLQQDEAPARVPAAFFLHFDPMFHRGAAAVEKHLEYFRATGMDFVKIQYEHAFPRQRIRRPEDWARVPLLGKEFFAEPLAVVDGIVKAVRREALVVVTLYSPFMCAGQVAGDELRDQHLREDPAAVGRGIEVVTAGLASFVRGCIECGVDGFYVSTQGGEATRFADRSVFAEYVKPYDLAIWQECLRGTAFNILHICDYHYPYADLLGFLDYPGDVVSYPLGVAGRPLSPRQAADLFKRPVMGGMDRHGAIAGPSEAEIRVAAASVLADAPARFILGADCTLPPDTPWGSVQAAIDVAHESMPPGRPGAASPPAWPMASRLGGGLTSRR
jgi:uroporphyrinogen decarboxylase